MGFALVVQRIRRLLVFVAVCKALVAGAHVVVRDERVASKFGQGGQVGFAVMARVGGDEGV